MNTNSMDKVASSIIQLAMSKGESITNKFESFLDYLIRVFDLDALMVCNFDMEKRFRELNQEANPFFALMADWIMEMHRILQNGESLDFFGEVYEKMFQGGGKRVAMQQYFTPPDVCNLCASIIVEERNDSSNMNEPTCGSGRNILAAWQVQKQHKTSDYYVGEDLDATSVKMCALNMLIHGMRGRVICHNTLFPNDFLFGYEINEVRFPFPTNAYSIRAIRVEEYLKD